MSHRLTRPALLLLLLTSLLTLIAWPVSANTSPAGLVEDQAKLLSATQLKELDQALSGRRAGYRVLILDRAFPGPEPAGVEARFQELAARLMKERAVPFDAVFITVALHEQLADFRVWEDGPVAADLHRINGRPLSAFGADLLNAFGGPASRGDIAGAIRAAVERSEAILATPPAPSAPVAPSAPSAPVAPVAPPAPVSPPAPISAPWLPWALAGGAALAVAVTLASRTAAVRQQRLAALAVRDGYLGPLLQLLERELPLIRNFDGDDTRTVAQVVAAAAEQSLHANQAAEAHLKQGEQLAGRMRYGAAGKALKEARAGYDRAAAAFAEARAAFEKIAEAIREYDRLHSQAQGAHQRAHSLLATERDRTGWPLTQLDARLVAAAGLVDAAESERQEDPVKAVRLVRDGEQGLSAALGDLEALPRLQEQLRAQTGRRQATIAAVADARTTLGLRFVEQDPDQPLAGSLRLEESTAGHLAAGAIESARQDLTGAGHAVDAAQAILDRYRQALAEYPEKITRLRRELDQVAGESTIARGTLADLAQWYAVDDWHDLERLPAEMAILESQGRSGLDEVAHLTSPAQQRYLKAVDLLDSMLAQRERLRIAYQTLRGRPDHLAAMVRQAGEQLVAADAARQSADAIRSRHHLIMPYDLQQQMAQVDEQIALGRRFAAARPVPATKALQVAGEAQTQAESLRQAVDGLAKLALQARERLDRARAQSRVALGYERFNPAQAGIARRALHGAETALAAGDYSRALAESDQVLVACQALEAAYRAHLAEEARRRREAEARRLAAAAAQAAARSAASRQSGGFGSTGGGGGGFGGGGRTGGGGGSWGGGGGRTGGGGGRWGS